MRTNLRSPAARLGCVLLASAFALSFEPIVPAQADPPPWAPAHGWRAKHEHGHGHKHKHHHDEDDDDEVAVLPYGLGQLTCKRDLIGAALGGAAGGLIGSQFGKGDGRTAATIGGVLIGLLVGGSVGRSMDEIDQACVNQVLEHVPDRQPIVWANGGEQYQVVPVRTWETHGRYCREYQTRATIGGRVQSVYGTACRQPDGSWQIMN